MLFKGGDINPLISDLQTEIYDIYHDESKEEAYWHGFLMVPRTKRAYFLSLLQEARENTKYYSEISYKKIKKTAKTNHETAIIIESWTGIALASLQQQKLDTLPIQFHLGGKPRVYKHRLDNLIKCKFVVFKERDKHARMFANMGELERIETTFRMGLKGGVHKLFDDNSPIKIGNVYIDGDEQYKGLYGRTFDTIRTLERLQNQVRNYVQFLSDSQLIPQRSDHNKIEKNQCCEDSYFLQLCDILLGGIRFHSYCPDIRHIKNKISHDCKILLEYDQGNIARMKESRFYNSFLLSEAWLENDEWNFKQLTVAKDKNLPVRNQLEFPLPPNLGNG